MAAMPQIPIGKMRAAIMAMVEDDLTVETAAAAAGADAGHASDSGV